MSTQDIPPKIHQGKNIKRFREMLGVKQDALAYELGDGWNQKKVSLLEARETVEPYVLDRVAQILHVPAQAIKSFNEEAAVQIISNTFSSNDNSTLNAVNYACNFNPIEKVIELYEGTIALYERMLKEKDEMIEKLAKKK